MKPFRIVKIRLYLNKKDGNKQFKNKYRQHNPKILWILPINDGDNNYNNNDNT